MWDQARAEVLQARHAALQEKLVLQQRLVKAQDRLSSIRRQEDQQQQQQRRQEEKEKRQTREAALQDICRQSLSEDRKKAAEQKNRRKAGSVTTPVSDVPSDTTSEPGGNNNNNNTSNGRARRHPGYRPSMALPAQPLPSSPMRELEDEPEDPSEVKDAVVMAGEGEVPWHHAQLYQLYGQEADYFLHPKQPEPQQTRQTHPKLRHQKGHIGAGELWETLRKDSNTKLLRNDQRFPQELKAAFSAFVRERLTLKHGQPVERSFCATKDVPDIERLMDQSKLRHVRMYRHKTELMYRSSLNNKDRTSILLHNNPMPDITETGQVDSISRYLPSWLDDESEISEAEYMKWIQNAPEREGETAEGDNVRRSAHSRQLSESTKELQSIWHSLSTHHKQPKTPRYRFLTEKAAACEGSFSQKFQEERENKDKLQPHHVLPFKSHSALELSLPSSSFSVPESRERGKSARSEMLHRYRSDWQPLSMTALVEYKKQLETMGEGDFEHGRMKMWPVVSFS